jgi:transposase
MADWRSGKRRQYSEAFKRQVVAEASADGVSASSVARLHGLNANLIFNWRRRFGGDRPVSFVPAVIIPEVSEGLRADGGRAGLEESSRSRLEVVCHGGRRIVVDGNFDADALRRLLAVVEDR